MTTPVYTQFPYKYISFLGTTTVSTVSGILHTVVIEKATGGTVTISDASGTVALFGTSTPAGTYTFDCSYAQPLTVACTATDFVTVMAGQV